jgi:membrane associated rhomboid family serine protease
MAIPLRDNAPHYDTPYITLCLIAINFFVFALEILTPGGPQAVINFWGLQPARIWEHALIPGTHLPAWLTLFTSTYLHFDIFHIASNMLILWLAGNSLEWVCGRLRFFLL